MGGNNQKGDQSQGNQNGTKNMPIYDNDGRIDYRGSWVINSYTTPNNNQLQTSHSTADNGSSFFVSFDGSQIQVLGIIPPGEDDLRAIYTLDNGQSMNRSVSALSQTSPLYYQMFFVSPVLSPGLHNLTVDIVETGGDRNYTFQMFEVASGGGVTGDGKGGKDKNHGTNDAAIVGGVLGTVIFLLVAFLVAFYFWRKRRLARISDPGAQRLPPMMYYARPMSDGSQRERALYTLEPASIIDTDSKFTFAMRRDAVDEPRQSWISINMPPSVPETALVSERPISDWSTYKGSSVVVQQSHAEVSHFSPYTSVALSPMAFKERTLPPVPSRAPGPPSQFDTLTSSSSPRPY